MFRLYKTWVLIDMIYQRLLIFGHLEKVVTLDDLDDFSSTQRILAVYEILLRPETLIWNAIRGGKFALIRPVTTSTEGR